MRSWAWGEMVRDGHRVSWAQVALCRFRSQFLCPGQVSAAILSLFPACHFFGARTQERQDPLLLSLPTSPACTAWFFKSTSWWLLLSTSPTEEFVALSSAYFLFLQYSPNSIQLLWYSWLFSCFVSIVLTLFLFKDRFYSFLSWLYLSIDHRRSNLSTPVCL